MKQTNAPCAARRSLKGLPSAAVALLIILILVSAPQAQQAPPAFAPAVAAGVPGAVAAPLDIDLLVGRSTVLNVGSPIARVSLTVPDIADAIVTAPSQLLIHGKQPGTISLFVWDRAGAIATYEVKVRRDLTPLIGHLKQLFPGEKITVMGSGSDVVISGTVSSKYVIEKAAEVAGGYVEKKENVVNLLQQQEGVASNQVMLRVRFAEVSRNALQELGAGLFSDGRNNQFGRITTQQFPAPFFDERQAMLGQSLVFSDYLNLFLFDAKNQLGAVVRALQGRGVFQSLAEPNLIALNGKEASFLAGGEFPYPIPQGQFGSFTIHFKEYGVRLSFTPTVLGGDLINLKIKPEVSSLDFNNAVVLEGFRIPALTSRRADTEIELRDGQTFAIAGLLNNTALSSMRKVPGIGDIPVLGALFRSRAYQKEQTELVVMVTPHIVRRDSTGVSEGLPALVEPYLAPPANAFPNPDPYTGSPRHAPVPPPRPRSESAPAPQVPADTDREERTGPPAGSPIQEGTPALPAAAGEPEPHPIASGEPLAGPAAAASPAPQDGAGARAGLQSRPADPPEDEAQRKRKAAAERERLRAEQREAERQKAEARAEEKRRAEAAKKAEEQRRQVERLERDRVKREAEVARKKAERARRQAEEDGKRQRAVADAAARLKEAQAAYEVELARSKGGAE